MVQQRFRHPVQVRWGDNDLLGHANNVAYLSWVEDARVRFIAALLGPDGGRLQQVVARQEIDYLAPVAVEVTAVEVVVDVRRLGSSSCTLGFEILLTDGTVVARGACVLVQWDGAAGRSTALDPAYRRGLEQYLADPEPTTA
jgi:acyl-CoA thioester hydrolase